MTSSRCTFCREHVDVVLWVFDGVSDYPIPACATCADRRRLKVFKAETDEGLVVPGDELATPEPGPPGHNGKQRD